MKRIENLANAGCAVAVQGGPVRKHNAFLVVPCQKSSENLREGIDSCRCLPEAHENLNRLLAVGYVRERNLCMEARALKRCGQVVGVIRGSAEHKITATEWITACESKFERS